MFQIKIAAQLVIVSKAFNAADKASIMEAVPQGTKRVVFVDTGITPVLAETIVALHECGIEVVVRDHHRGEGRNPEAAETVERLLGDNARIVTRASMPACSGLIEVGEFSGEGTVIVADPDMDGLTAAMKCVGVVYEGLDADAAVFDERPKQSAETLTPLGWTACRALATLPAFDKDRPEVSEKAKAELFTTFVEAASGDSAARENLESRVAAYEAGVAEAERILASDAVSNPCPGVAMADVTGAAGRYDLNTLSRGLEARGGLVTVVRTKNGPIAKAHGVQLSLAVTQAHQRNDKKPGGIDLRELVPSGTATGPEAGLISNVGFLLHCSPTVWETVILPALAAKLNG